jgi:hypothetical protein
MGYQRQIKQTAFGDEYCHSLPFWTHRFHYMKVMDQLPTVLRRNHISVAEVLEPPQPITHPWAYTPEFSLLYHHQMDLQRIQNTIRYMNL